MNQVPVHCAVMIDSNGEEETRENKKLIVNFTFDYRGIYKSTN